MIYVKIVFQDERYTPNNNLNGGRDDPSEDRLIIVQSLTKWRLFERRRGGVKITRHKSDPESKISVYSDCEEFQTVDELRAISWVKEWSDSVDFTRFAIVPEKDACLLMAVFGKEGWVVGRINVPEVSGLPEWR